MLLLPGNYSKRQAKKCLEVSEVLDRIECLASVSTQYNNPSANKDNPFYRLFFP